MEELTPEQRGRPFEIWTEFFLQIDPTYATKLKAVWHEKNLPATIRNKLGLPTPEIGVDLVAETEDGDYWAIQCKYHHDPTRNLTKNELNSFIDLTTRICAGKFSTLLVVSSAQDVSINLRKYASQIQYCLGNHFQSLGEEFFRQVRALIRKRTPKIKKRTPLPHQRLAIQNAVDHFIKKRETRGKLIHPCGTGKSLTGYWISEALEAKTALVALPSLHLVRQTLADWTRESLATGRKLDWMVVCSDPGIQESDDPAMRFHEMGVDVTTDAESIALFLRKRGQGHKVIFTTYQSGKVTAKAARLARRVFDVGIFDEAHRTVGQKDSNFSHLIAERNIRIRKRVFMTATERRYRGSSESILSMDDVDSYGETFDLITFREALEKKEPILSDYKVITMVVARSEIQHLIDENFLVKPDKGKWNVDTEARTLAALIALRKVMKRHRAKHALTFHNSIAKAQAFKESQEKFNEVVKGYGHAACFHVSSKVSTAERDAEIERFRIADKAIITNAKCLTEGVDVPTIDAVLFADSKRSTVDIVQAAGRALRRAAGKKMGYIIVPVLVDENDPDAADKAFQDILMTLRALAANDDRIIEYFRSVAQGVRLPKGTEVVDVNISDGVKIDLAEFSRSIQTQVWHRLAKISWRPFEEARAFVRDLGLQNIAEWKAYSRGESPDVGIRPADIPSNPNQAYKNQGWSGLGDWLGTGSIASYNRTFRSFEQARSFVHSLKLGGQSAWRKWCKQDIPEDIPKKPERVYANGGWSGWGDWLGTGYVASQLRNYRKFKEARQFVRGLKLKNWKEWDEYRRGLMPEKGPKPEDIPYDPTSAYGRKITIGDWIGTGSVAPKDRRYLSFKNARKFVRSLNLSGSAEWNKYSRGDMPEKGNRPLEIPSNPGKTYAKKGWVNMGDWLGTGKTATFDRNYRSFRAARAFARSLGLKNGYEWSDFAKGNLPGKGALPGDIPAAPFTVYIKDGWKGMGDWLGTGNIAATKYKWLSFKKARSFVQKLGLRGQREWVKYCKGEMPEIGIRPPNIPTDPRVVYGEKGFVGYGDWLGTGAVQTNKRVFRSFKEARKFARGLCLKNSSEWFAFCRGDLQRTKGKRPGDIPTSPKVVYVNKGWEGFGDWLGTGAVGKTKRVFRSFKDARKFARKLGLKSYAEWGAYCRGDFQRTKGKLPKDIPKDPRSAYKNKGWLSVGDWLGKKT